MTSKAHETLPPATRMLPWSRAPFIRSCGQRLPGLGFNIPNSGSRVAVISRLFRNTAHYSTPSEASNNTDVSHSEFIAHAGSSSSWKEMRENSLDGGTGDELDKLTAGKGAFA
jgi:hypothetical protein